jgi:hypothetical protein
MAFNNYFPTSYQPAQIYYPQQQAQPQTQQTPQSLIWVQGEAGAKSYLVAPNSTVTLWDSEAQTIYIKSADATGMPSIRTLDYTIRGGEEKAAVNYVTKDDFDRIEKEIDDIKKSLGKEKK